MEPKDRIIVALDVKQTREAAAHVQTLRSSVGLFKIGLEFIYSMLRSLLVPGNADAISNLGDIRELFELLAHNLFWDGKLNDIPNTIKGASGPITDIGVKMFNIHCLSGPAAMEAARKESEEFAKRAGYARPLALGVTVLTSLSYDDLVKMGIMKYHGPGSPLMAGGSQEADARIRMEELVVCLARLAKECGLDGVVCSPQEIVAVREACGPEFQIVTPGVRPVWAAVGDQKRVMTPGEAIAAGADYLVIGRPILQPPPEIGRPSDAAAKIAEEIGEVMAKGDTKKIEKS